MALKKEYSYGSKAGNYWRIIGIHPNSMYSNTKVRIALYKDRATREKDDASYCMVLPFSIPGSNHTQDTAYKELKNKAEFTDAEDC
jgi:hypothetical protein